MKHVVMISTWLVLLGLFTQIRQARAEKPISLQIENLTHWKKSPKSSAVRQSLDAMLKPRRNYSRSLEFIKKIKPYAPLFRRPFLLLETEPHGFGGFSALIVFKNHPKVFSVWIYELDKNVFELREVTPLKATLNHIIMRELEDKRIAPFWL